MKKLWLAATIALSASATFVTSPSTVHTASAKAYDMKPTFAKDLRNGTMPRLHGKVGMTYSTLKKKEKGYAFPSDMWNLYQTPNEDLYGFEPKMTHPETISGAQKVKIIMRSYNYQITESSVKKYFGASYRGQSTENGRDEKAHIYKAGNYYVYFISHKNYTSISVGTKKAIQQYAWIKNIYK